MGRYQPNRFCSSLLFVAFIALAGGVCTAENAKSAPVNNNIPNTAEPVKHRPPRNALRRPGQGQGSFFKKGFSAAEIFDPERFNGSEVINLDEEQPAEDWKAPVAAPAPAAAAPAEAAKPAEQNEGDGLPYAGDKQGKIYAPGSKENTEVVVSPDAPAPARGLIKALRDGNEEEADLHADDLVQMQQNYFFEVRQIVSRIGEAMIRKSVIEEDKWVGAEQDIDRQLALTRKEHGILLRPTHDVAMKRIVPDEQNKVEVFYFFSLTCSFCRYMAADVERLYQATKKDPNVKFTAVTIGDTPADLLENYRDYTGLTMPLFDGTEFAKQMRIGFVPAVVIIAPTGKRAYSKTGQQSFENLYEFVRTVQGLPLTLTPEVQLALNKPIGEAERQAALQDGKQQLVKLDKFKVQKVNLQTAGQNPSAGSVGKKLKVELDRF